LAGFKAKKVTADAQILIFKLGKNIYPQIASPAHYRSVRRF
jgi:hypothetical protein